MKRNRRKLLLPREGEQASHTWVKRAALKPLPCSLQRQQWELHEARPAHALIPGEWTRPAGTLLPPGRGVPASGKREGGILSDKSDLLIPTWIWEALRGLFSQEAVVESQVSANRAGGEASWAMHPGQV